MNPIDLLPGDIPAIRIPKGFLPKSIRVFMWLWMLIRYRRFYKGKLYNHTMIMLSKFNCAEAIGKGFVIRSFSLHFSDKLEYMGVFRLKVPLSATEAQRMRDKAKAMANANIEYEIFNFFCWIVYILTNGKKDIFPSPEKRENKVFCFEVSATLLNAARPGFFPLPDHVNTVDLQFDDRFEFIPFHSNNNCKPNL